MTAVNWACVSNVKRDEKQPVPGDWTHVVTGMLQFTMLVSKCKAVSKRMSQDLLCWRLFVETRKHISMWVCRNAAWSSCTFFCLQFVSPVPCIIKRSQAGDEGVHAYAKYGHLWSKVGGKKVTKSTLTTQLWLKLHCWNFFILTY